MFLVTLWMVVPDWMPLTVLQSITKLIELLSQTDLIILARFDAQTHMGSNHLVHFPEGHLTD